MVLKIIGLRQNKIILIFFSILFFSNLYSQQNITLKIDSIFTNLMDQNLNVVSASNILKLKTPIVIISNLNCGGCVNYFEKSKNKYSYIFIINSKSLLEINTIIKMHQLKDELRYFILCKDINLINHDICSSPTPCLINYNEASFLFYNYALLKKISNDYTLNAKKFLKKINSKIH